ncbi:hypothetical protein QTP70_026383 [Hemibagrus guttatus]|uniref:Uncharacterized protein n=1 Tax=Hemibagrus guttatus TaxID=175788 RepID=A0AAE0VBP9_9TELE|nr:hypothetical protein QTP70_026383 [Hemibagrus guttatus]
MGHEDAGATLAELHVLDFSKYILFCRAPPFFLVELSNLDCVEENLTVYCVFQLKVWMNWAPFWRKGFLDQDMGHEDAGAALAEALSAFIIELSNLVLEALDM